MQELRAQSIISDKYLNAGSNRGLTGMQRAMSNIPGVGTIENLIRIQKPDILRKWVQSNLFQATP